MIAWVRRMLDRPAKPAATPENTEVRHKAVLKRADALLRVAHDYALADKARRERR